MQILGKALLIQSILAVEVGDHYFSPNKEAVSLIKQKARSRSKA